MSINHGVIKEALLIRRVEETFLALFSRGRLNGTVHTCIGQEFSALAFAGQLRKSDFIFSNHRCHGHYLSFTGDTYGLIAELLGKKTGASGGVGSSQHLCHNNFYSNGVQGGIIPVSAGMALANKLQKNNNIGIVFIGDGTLGEGVLYETMNIISKWEIPLLIVCENNYYAQSTHHSANLAGSILARAEAFNIKAKNGDTWHVEELMDSAADAINYVRNEGKPLFHLVNTYRLNAHSKGDDDRSPEEIERYREMDFLNRFSKEDPDAYNNYLEQANSSIATILEQAEQDKELTLEEYFQPLPENADNSWKEIVPINRRQVELINDFFRQKMATDKKAIFIGEDILSPYGGAFKVAKNLSELYPDRVFSTPISEAAITGISNGLALAGFKPYAEIMFGDFITLTMDQLVNHAAKFHHMYNGKVNCPLVIRTPMGGGRGYGPTHSQTLDKLLIGIDNVTTIALNSFIDPSLVYQSIHEEKSPVIVIENKLDYGKKIGNTVIKNYSILYNSAAYPVIKAMPLTAVPTITLVTYGGIANMVVHTIPDIFNQADEIADVIILTRIHPVDYAEIIRSVQITGKLVVIEEGSKAGGIGSEIVATVMERMNTPIITRRIAALPVPIPSVKSLENIVLPSAELIIKEILNLGNE